MPTPPGPRTPALIQGFQFLRDPIGFHNGLRNRYGPLAHARFIGGEHAVFVMDPKLAQQVLRSDPGVGMAGEGRARYVEPLIGTETLLTLDGEGWSRHHEMLGSAFHSSSIAGFSRGISELIGAEVDSWPRDTEIALAPAMTTITLQVILRAVFGMREGPRLRELRALLPTMLELGPIFTFMPPAVRDRVRTLVARGFPPRLLPGGRFVKLRGRVDAVLLAEIADRRRADDLSDRADVLSKLIEARDADGRGLDDLELRDELLSLLVAGYETTSSELSWAFERLVRHPAVMERLREEIDAGDGDAYLRAVVEETLRMRAVGHLVPRALNAPMELGGYTIPAEWKVAVSTLAIHGDPRSWPDPEAFRPERFTEERPNRPAFMPFGGGRRYCTGAPLARLEMRLTIREVIGRVELSAPARAERTRIHNVVIQPSRGARVRVRDRVRADARAAVGV